MLRNLGFIGLHKKRSKLCGEIDSKIIENNNVPLEEILSEDTVVDELQNQNKLLIKYLNKERIKQMIDYIIKEPPNDISYDKGHKFPWVCSQLFNIGDPNIMKYFLKTNKELEEERLEEEEKKNKDENNLDEKNNINKEKNNKKDKKININEIIDQKEKDNRIELLDYLLTFLSSETEPNYVLCGYFASIIKTLLTMDQTVIIKYLYIENKEFIRKLIYHSYRQSISEILNKIVQYDSNVDEFNAGDMALIRMDILEGLFDQIEITMDTEKLDSISTLIKSLATDERLLSDMLNNRKIIECLVTRPFKGINLLINYEDEEELVINKRRNFNILIDIIIKWINSIHTFDIDLPSTSEDDEESEESESDNYNLTHTILSYELFNVLENLIKVNFNKNNNNDSKEKKILQSFDEKHLVPLGLFRIKIVELLGNLFTYFKNISQLYDKLLIDCQFFENAFIYLFEYELNNIYQEALLFLFKKFLNYSDDHPLLADFIFVKLNLMETIISKLKDTEMSENPEENSNKSRFLYKSGNTTSRGYISFLISLSYKINTIIGGDPLRINNTLSREGSISFITRTAPFVGKEEINEFYGMDEDELYEAVSNESGERTSKFNCAIKSMEKYLNDKWNDYFYDHIADKIKLYETKLYKDQKRDSIFHNPFILENDDENVENDKNNFGLGEDEDEDVLGKQKKKEGTDYEKFLYGEDVNGDIDINVNRFKMSMRLPRSSKNSKNLKKAEEKRGSWDNKPSKVVVDEIDDVDTKDKNEDDNDDLDKHNANNDDEDGEENPLDKFKRMNKNKNDNHDEDEEENPLDKFKRLNKDKNNNNEEEEEENPLDKFRRINKNKNDNNNEEEEEEEEENPLDKFRRINKDKNDNNNEEEEEEENPLDKFRRINKNKEEKNEEDEEEEENPLDKFKRLNKK